MFYWARGNDSVSGLDTLRLAQYTIEDHYTSESEAVYETGTQRHKHTAVTHLMSVEQLIKQRQIITPVSSEMTLKWSWFLFMADYCFVSSAVTPEQ